MHGITDMLRCAGLVGLLEAKGRMALIGVRCAPSKAVCALCESVRVCLYVGVYVVL